MNEEGTHKSIGWKEYNSYEICCKLINHDFWLMKHLVHIERAVLILIDDILDWNWYNLNQSRTKNVGVF